MCKEQICNNCGHKKELDVTSFYRNPENKNGFSKKCISCTSLYSKNRRINIKKIRVIHEAKIDMSATKEIIEIIDELSKLKMYQNLAFISGDGGYKRYIDTVKEHRSISMVVNN